jgi:hypothetical protein
MKLYFTKLIIVGALMFCINTISVFAQAPCNTSFTGNSPCNAEFIALGLNCASSVEEMRTNACTAFVPATSSCGISGTNIVWSKFIVGVADNVTITWTATNNRNLRLGLYQFTDECDGVAPFGDYGETEIACVNAGGNGVDETLTQFLTPGTYYIAGKSNGNLAAGSQICAHSPSAIPSITASDCGVSVDVCTNLNFTIDPNGSGVVNEIPTSGTVSNPSTNPGSANSGCLLSGETNSTWMVVNISSTGDLEFTFGGGGLQAGYYDWIMYPYSPTVCADIIGNTLAPVRCNWNGVNNGGTGLAPSCCLPVGGDASNFEPPLAVTAGDQFIICFSNYSSVNSTVPLNFNGTAGVSCVPLPIELLSFDVESIGDEVSIFWSSLSEINNDFFVVERSVDGVSFEEIDIVFGSGNSSELRSYNVIDENPYVGVNYYRLKQVDFDGKYRYSSVVSINMELTKKIRMYPNPANRNIVVEGVFPGSTIEIFTTMGNPMLSIKLKVESEMINVENIPSGVYFVKISNEVDVLVKKINIVH